MEGAAPSAPIAVTANRKMVKKMGAKRFARRGR
jgi:hypothetical protein